MEEKKSLKISLSTFFLFIAIIVIILMACYIYKEKTNSNKEIADLEANSVNMQNTIDDLQGKIDSISNTINSDKVLEDKNNTSSSTKYIDIKKELNENELFKITKAIDNKNGTYTLEGKLYRPYTISETELNEILDNGNLEYDNTKFTIKKGEQKGTYDLYPEKYPDVVWYTLYPIENSKSYKMESNTEYSDVWKETEDYRQLTISNSTKCIYSSDSNDELTDTVENVFGKKLYWGGYFKFSFKNNECASINEVVIGH